MTEQYDPTPHMTTIKTRQGPMPYLAVKYRLLWLRKEHPDARVIAEKVDGGIEAGWVEFKATVEIPGGGISVDYASETRADFPDFYEKASTKAIGRALATLGYGTDAAPDMDDGEPMDGRAAAKDERATRAIAAQHERNIAPAAPQPPRPTVMNTPRARQEPDGQERARAAVEAKCEEKGIPVLDGDTYETIAETVNKALFDAGKGIEVRTDAHGTVTPGAILNALMALPTPDSVAVSTGR